MKCSQILSRLLPAVLLAATLSLFPAQADDKTPVASNRPIRALIVTGGCCHDYPYQTMAILHAADRLGVKVDWTIVMEGGKGTEAKISLYEDPNWAQGFDVVFHNECFANTTDPDYIRRITEAHKAGVNAVVIHCAMHTYRAAEIDDWREFLGVTSRRHDHQSRYPVKVVAPDHAIMQGFPTDFSTPMDELYIIEKVWPNTKVLATSISEKSGDLQPVFWTNTYGKARVFGTTYGHSKETFGDEVFVKTLIRGMQWAAGRLGDVEQLPTPASGK